MTDVIRSFCFENIADLGAADVHFVKLCPWVQIGFQRVDRPGYFLSGSFVWQCGLLLVQNQRQWPVITSYSIHYTKLYDKGKKSYDINLEVAIRPKGAKETIVCKSNFKHMYWNMSQQLAHHTVNGCPVITSYSIHYTKLYDLCYVPVLED